MKPFRAVVRLKNNRLVRLREELNLTSVAIAEKIGIALGTYVNLENLKCRAFRTNNKEWTATATKIAEFHGVSCDWIWPDEVKAIRARALILEANARDLVGVPSILALEGKEVRGILGPAAERVLTSMEINVLKRRITTDDPEQLHDIGKDYGVSRERIRQIQDNALRKLRQLRTKGAHVEVQRAVDLLREEAKDRFR